MEKKPKKIKFISIHSVEIKGTSERPKLNFTGLTKNFNEYNVECEIDDYDIRQLIKNSIKHFENVESVAKGRLRDFRKDMNYSNSEPVISYEKPSN